MIRSTSRSLTVACIGLALLLGAALPACGTAEPAGATLDAKGDSGASADGADSAPAIDSADHGQQDALADPGGVADGDGAADAEADGAGDGVTADAMDHSDGAGMEILVELGPDLPNETSAAPDDALDAADGTPIPDIIDANGDFAVPDAAADGPELPPAWVDPCAATPAPAYANTTPVQGFPLLGHSCAKPGWPSPPAATPFVWTDVTASIGLDQGPYLDACLLWQDVSGDNVADIAVVRQPLGPTSARLLTLYSGDGSGKFVTSKSKIPNLFMVMDCAAGDFDKNGLVDIVMVGLTGARIFINLGDGTFADGTAKMLPITAQNVMAWSVGVLDYDRDGDLDVYLARTGQLPLMSGNFACQHADLPYYQCCFGSKTIAPGCTGALTKPIELYSCCQSELGASDRLLRNDGTTFTDVSDASGANNPHAGLSATVHDLDRDGWPDLFVGNDFGPPGWHRNRGDGTFQKLATEIGLRPYGHNMGSAVADLDGDGWQDLVTSDFGPTTLYRGQAGGTFSNGGQATGVWEKTKDIVSWAQLAADFDNDGHVDLVTGVSLGAKPGELPAAVQLSKSAQDLGASHLVYHNVGNGKLVPTALPLAPGAEQIVDSVVVAASDLEGDGDLDLAISSRPGLVRVYRNDTPKTGNWLRVDLSASDSAPGAVGALVQVWSGGHVLERWATATPGYGARGLYDLHFGLGSVAELDQVRVWWPSGQVSLIGKTKANQVLLVQEVDAMVAGTAQPGNDAGPADGAGDGGDAADAPDGDAGSNPVSGITPLDLTTVTTANFTDITDEFGFADYKLQFKHTYCTLGADLDGDGRDDLLVIEDVYNATNIHAILMKSSGKVHVKSPIDTTLTIPAYGCAAADLNGDTKLDLLIGTSAGLAAYLNGGEGSFTDVTAKYMPDIMDFVAWSAAVGDLDGDQDIEILTGSGEIAAYCEGVACAYSWKDFGCTYAKPPIADATMQDRLFSRKPGQAFEDHTVEWKLPSGGEATEVTLADIDQDGWLDAMIGTDFGPHYLMRNEKGKLVQYGATAGFKSYAHAMGIGVGDFDGDTLLDLAMADAGPNLLYIQKKAPVGGAAPLVFEDEAEAWGLAAATHDLATWDPLVEDFDQDGDVDLYLGVAGLAPDGALGPLGMCTMPKQPKAQRDVLMLNQGGKFAVQVSPKPDSQAMGFAAVAQTALDVDEDGDLDVLQVRRDGYIRVLRNDFAMPGAFVRVRLKSKSANTAAVGARAVAWVAGKPMVRQLVGNSGFGGTGVWRMHFGLGAAAKISLLQITWPSGKKTELTDVAAGSKLALAEP